MHPFRAAVEARDTDAVLAVLADNVVFRSPIVFKPYSGKGAAVLSAALPVIEDFVYEAELESADGSDHALMFSARVDEKESRGRSSAR